MDPGSSLGGISGCKIYILFEKLLFCAEHIIEIKYACISEFEWATLIKSFFLQENVAFHSYVKN